MVDDETRTRDPAALLPAEFDGFEVIRPLGRGGMGTVYLGRDVMLDRPVALKFIASSAPTPRARERFLLEARAIARLQHPNVVGIYRIGSVEGHPYLAYELVAGRALHQVERPVPWRLALSIALSAARGLAAVHRRDILHRDIKPANLILLDHGEVKLLDFGLAKLVDDATPVVTHEGPLVDPASPVAADSPTEPGAAAVTTAGMLAGTPAYMAPELWRGEPASARSDIYALGLVMYELLVGSLPWVGGEREQPVEILARDLPRLSGQRDDAPRPLLEAIDRMTLRDARDRFRDADELCARLEEINAVYQPFTDAPRDDAARDETLLQQSFTRVAADADTFSQGFYDRVFASNPELRGLFPADLTALRRKLVAALQLVVRNVQHSEVVVPMLVDLGARHARYGARTQHFEAVGAALMATLAASDAAAWTPELERVWSFAYQRLAATMITALEQQLADGSAPSAPQPWTPPLVMPRTRYTRRGDVSLAYQLSGSGAVTLVMVPGWVSHLEQAWHEPAYARFLGRLSTRARVLCVEKRGTGLSDRLDHALSLEHQADDVLAVMDAAGVDRAALFGVGDSAPVCALVAATVPERVRALVLYGSAPRLLAGPDYPEGMAARDVDTICAAIRTRWGEPLFLDLHAPSRSDDPKFAAWWAAFLRTSASPAAAEALIRASAEYDVRPALAQIEAPTLVLHRIGDRCIPLAGARRFAAAIPGATLAELAGQDHLPFAGDSDEVIDRIIGFLYDAPTAATGSL